MTLNEAKPEIGPNINPETVVDSPESLPVGVELDYPPAETTEEWRQRTGLTDEKLHDLQNRLREAQKPTVTFVDGIVLPVMRSLFGVR